MKCKIPNAPKSSVSRARAVVDYNHNRRLRFLIDYIVIMIIIVIIFFEIV